MTFVLSLLSWLASRAAALALLVPGAGAVKAAIGSIVSSAAGTLIGRIFSNKYVLMALAMLIGLGAAWLHGHHVAARACKARIDSMVKQAEAARQKRDADIAASIEGKYVPIVAGLQKRADDLQQQVSNYEKRKLSAVASRPCALGADALRLRQRR